MAVLATVAVEDGYGYDVVRRLRDGGLDDVGDASVYGTLRRLYTAGALTSYVVPSESGPHRKYYGINAEGRALLKTQRDDWDHFRAPSPTSFTRRGPAHERHRRDDPPPRRRRLRRGGALAPGRPCPDRSGGARRRPGGRPDRAPARTDRRRPTPADVFGAAAAYAAELRGGSRVPQPAHAGASRVGVARGGVRLARRGGSSADAVRELWWSFAVPCDRLGGCSAPGSRCRSSTDVSAAIRTSG